MSDELVVSQCAPTLAGLKTANMFSAEYESREEVTAELRRLNAVLVPRGLRIVPMRFMQSRVLLYLYRPEALRRDLAGGQHGGAGQDAAPFGTAQAAFGKALHIRLIERSELETAAAESSKADAAGRDQQAEEAAPAAEPAAIQRTAESGGAQEDEQFRKAVDLLQELSESEGFPIHQITE